MAFNFDTKGNVTQFSFINNEFNIKKLNVALFFILCKELDIDINRLSNEIYFFI